MASSEVNGCIVRMYVPSISLTNANLPCDFSLYYVAKHAMTKLLVRTDKWATWCQPFFSPNKRIHPHCCFEEFSCNENAHPIDPQSTAQSVQKHKGASEDDDFVHFCDLFEEKQEFVCTEFHHLVVIWCDSGLSSWDWTTTCTHFSIPLCGCFPPGFSGY